MDRFSGKIGLSRQIKTKNAVVGNTGGGIDERDLGFRHCKRRIPCDTSIRMVELCCNLFARFVQIAAGAGHPQR